MKCRFRIALIALTGFILAGSHFLYAQDEVSEGRAHARPTRHTHAPQARGAAYGRQPRSGIPTIGDSLFQAVSWLQPSTPSHSVMPARYRHSRATRSDRHGSRHASTVHSVHHHGGVHTHADHVNHNYPSEVDVHLEEPVLEAHEPQPMAVESEIYVDGGFGHGGYGHGDCCHPSGACDTCCLIPFPSICWDNFEVGFGIQGYTGPVNRGETGSFGINQSMNLGVPFPLLVWHEIGGQIGVRGTQSNFSGAEFTSNERRQFFMTTGFFHRVDWGFQGGIVVDYLYEEWYMQADLAQLRGELSWVFPCSHEWGFWFNRHIRDDNVTSRVGAIGALANVNERYQTTDVYAFFYRYRAEELGGEARAFGGFTGDSDGIIGVDMRIPIAARWDIDGGFTYLVPEESTNNRGHEEESWNIGVNLVYYPGCRTTCDSKYYRPLFDVADNGTFLVDRQ